MIGRIWHGWTTPEHADAYEELLRTEILPGIANRNIDGYRGAHLLRRRVGNEVEFTTICWFDDLDAVKAFAGENYAHSVVPEKARRLLSRFDDESQHYQTVISPG